MRAPMRMDVGLAIWENGAMDGFPRVSGGRGWVFLEAYVGGAAGILE